MRKLFLFTLLILAFVFTANAQESAPEECPKDKVCISREAAIKANIAMDKVPGLENEIAVLKEEINKERAQKIDLLVKFTEAQTKATLYEKLRIEDAAQNEKKKNKCFFCIQSNKK